MRLPLSARALPFALLLLAACSSPPPSGGGGAGGGGGASTDCLITGCGQTEACVNGSCLPRSCTDAVCGTDEVCSDGKCTPKSCVGQSCPSGTVCVPGGTCAPQACGDGGFCGSDQVCTDQGCVDSRCVGLTCQSGEVCANGRCYAPSCGGIACGPGFVCDNGCVETVCAGIICPGGARCTGGVCSTSCGTVNCDQPPADACEGAGIRHYQPFGSCDPQSATCSYSSALESCDSPPAAECKDAQTLRRYSPAGSCDGGACEYAAEETPCNSPPSPSCVSGTTLRTFSAAGSCSAGVCSYTPTDITCPTSCANNACVGSNRVFQQIGPDFDGVVTSVEIPPNSDGGTVVVVGKGGFAARYDGTGWSTVKTGTQNDLNSVWLSGLDGGYAVGAAKTILQYDGASFAPITVAGPAANLVSVHGSSPSHVLIAGSVNNWWRFDGQNWTTGTFTATGPVMHTAYVAANNRERIAGNCLVFSTPVACVASAGSASAGFSVNTYSQNSIFDFTALGSVACCNTAALVGGAGTALFHTDTGGFSTSCTCNATAVSFGPFSPGNLTGFAQGPLPASLLALTEESSATPGQGGRLFQDLGNFGNPTSRMATYGTASLSRNPGAVVAVADATARATSVFQVPLTSVGAGAGKPIALGEDWRRVVPLPIGFNVLMNGKGDIASVSSSGVPQGFVRTPGTRPDMFALAASQNFGIVAGANGTVLRLNLGATSFTTVASTAFQKTWRAACRVSDSEIYLVGDNGQIALYDGANLTAMPSGTTSNLEDVYCIGSDSAVAVGEGSTVLKLASGLWTPLTPALPTGTGLLTSVEVDANGAIYVGGPSYFGRHAAGSWTALATLNGLNGLVLVSPTEAYAFSTATGSAGKILSKFDGATWTTAFTAPWPLADGALSSGTVVYAGQGGVVLRGQ